MRSLAHPFGFVGGLLATVSWAVIGTVATAHEQVPQPRFDLSTDEQQPAQPPESGLKGVGIIEHADDGPIPSPGSLPSIPELAAAALQLYAFFPQAGTLWQDLVLNNHVDLSSSGTPFDFDCTDRTYSGHRGHDADIVGFREQQAGVPVFAAIDGTVLQTHDGEDDMNTQALGQASNYVAIAHGSGQASWYLHLKKDSVAVSAGQTVTAGAQIGLTGSSGNSTWPHLHFESQVNGVPYEPSAGPCRPGPSYWVSQVAVRQATFVKTFTFADVPFWGNTLPEQMRGYPWDQVVHSGTYVVGTAATYFRMSIANWPANGGYRITYTRPNGSTALDFSGVVASPFRNGWMWFQMNPGGGLDALGTWTARFYVNGSLTITAPFEVVATSGEVVNRAPLGVSVALDPPVPGAADVPFCRLTPSVLYRRDPDYDMVRYRYRWTVNGTVARDVQSAGLSDAIPKGSVGSGDVLTCAVTPIDDYAVEGPLSLATNTAGGNLLQNNDFESGTTGWLTFGAPDASYMEWTLTNGVFQWRRVPQMAEQPVSQAVVFQNTGVALAAGTAMTATFDLGNTSGARKYMKVLLVSDAGFGDLAACVFWLEPNAPLRTYQMQGYTTQAWTNAAIYFYASSPNTDEGYYQVDNVSFAATPGGSLTRTDCVDPLAPVPPGGAAGPNLVTNGDFASGLPAPWGTFGTITLRDPIVGEVLEMIRPTGDFPRGVVLNATTQAMALHQILTATFQLGNSSGVRQRVLVLVHDLDFTDLVACNVWLAPAQGLTAYTMTLYASKAWTNATVAVYPRTVGNVPWVRLDNVTLTRTPATAIVGTTCEDLGPAPAPGPAPAMVAPSMTSGVVVLPGPASRPGAAAAISPSATPSATPPGRGATRWTAASEVALSPGATWIGSARGWDAVATVTQQATVQWVAPLGLTTTSSAVLRFESWLASRASAAEVQVSLDGVAWVTAHDVQSSDTWETVEVDLRAFVGQVVYVQLVFDAVAPVDPAEPDTWRVEAIEVEVTGP